MRSNLAKSSRAPLARTGGGEAAGESRGIRPPAGTGPRGRPVNSDSRPDVDLNVAKQSELYIIQDLADNLRPEERVELRFRVSQATASRRGVVCGHTACQMREDGFAGPASLRARCAVSGAGTLVRQVGRYGLAGDRLVA